MTTLILKQHTLDIVRQLIDAKIPCHTCVDFIEAPWLSYNSSVSEFVHSVGYPDNDQGTTSEQELERFVAKCKDLYYCNNVEEFIAKINEQRNLTQADGKTKDLDNILGRALAGEDVSHGLRSYVDE